MILNLLQIYKDFEKPANPDWITICISEFYMCFELKPKFL